MAALFGSSIGLHAQERAVAPGVNVVPLPARIALQGKPFVLRPKLRIVTDGDQSTLMTAGLLADRLRTATGFSIPIQTAPTVSKLRDAIVLSSKGADAALGEEGYELSADSQSVVIRAPHAAGLFYGTQTLRQLLPPLIESKTKVKGLAWSIRGVHIWDQPRFSYRGFMLDSSRHLQSEEFVKRTLDLMAYHKLNIFHWHLVDDNGWRIEIKKYPRLTAVGGWRVQNGQRYGGFFTQDQIRNIVAYARQRHITIIPEIEMPGHSAAAVAAYPELACKPDAFTVKTIGESALDVFCPGKPSTFTFLEDVLTEVMALFPSQIIHIGGDEVNKTRWKACPNCQALIKREGLQNEDELQSWFTRRMAAFLHSKGRRLQGWDEIMHGGALPSDVIVQQWDQPQAAVLAARAGNDVVVSQTGWTYFDYSYETTSLRKVYEAEPVPSELTLAQAKHILGAQAQLWTESRVNDASADRFIWPRLIALAEVCWSPREARNWDGFMQRLNDAHFTRLTTRGLGTSATAPDVVRNLLIDPAGERHLGSRVAEWKPEQMSETIKAVDWEVSSSVKMPGTYQIHLNFQQGAHGIAISSVALLENGTEIARDAHAGWAGAASHDNTYDLNVAGVRAGAKYVLRVELRSDGGVDSRGNIWLKAPVVTTKR